MTAIGEKFAFTSVRWTELDIGCLLLATAVDAGEVAETLMERTGLAVPGKSGRLVRDGDRIIIWLSPRSWLVQCPLAEVQALKSRVCDAFPDAAVHAAVWSDQLAWFRFSGLDAVELLSRGGFLSLEQDRPAVGCARRTLLANIKVHLLRPGADDWLIGVERSQRLYFVRWLGKQIGGLLEKPDAI
ncbi:MAG: sarcosine oxidase subunit gamma family protein [Pseudaminobacter sp.]